MTSFTFIKDGQRWIALPLPDLTWLSAWDRARLRLAAWILGSRLRVYTLRLWWR